MTHNCIVVETVALVQRRHGMAVVRALLDDVLPVIAVFWVEEALHQVAETALLAAGRRDISLVDWVSFEGMRLRGIGQAFAFDEDFQRQGFVVVPGSS